MDSEVLLSEAVALLRRLIETPRPSRQEARAADVLEGFIQERGLDCKRVGSNLVLGLERHDVTLPTLLLNAHIDTVKPTTAWTRSPYEPSLEGEALYGIGANDDGAPLVCLLQAYRMLLQGKQPYNLLLALTAEEEVSGKGGIESVLPLLPKVDVALVGEPTSMQPAIAEKGLMVLDVTAKGRAGHAARQEGDNAIYRAIDDMQWFRAFQFPKVSPLLGAVKMTVTIVNAGTQHNVVPSECQFTVDVRSNELYSNEELLRLIAQSVQGEVKARSTRLGSSSISPSHPLVLRAIELGGKPFGSPTLSDQALLPFPSLKLGPGDSRRSHTADEYILLPELRRAIPYYYRLLDGLSL
ncbi:MAG: M20 family metallo-hydrolase [Prevotellaceae bacterium]|nr:M20 family metallo-hydrolase [Prevotellaceae bacterium]